MTVRDTIGEDADRKIASGNDAGKEARNIQFKRFFFNDLMKVNPPFTNDPKRIGLESEIDHGMEMAPTDIFP